MNKSRETNDLRSEPLVARQYQLQLLEYVTLNNGIIYLPTGAGKTFVAILALKRFSAHFDKTPKEGGKRAVFMCNTVELARQQANELRKHTNLKVGLYLGERDVDHWEPRIWQKEIQDHQVLVGTVQIFVNIVSGNLIKITDFSIVIIDECHHGVKNHPMHEFMRLFQNVQNQNLLPRVIGLTGVLLKGNKLNVKESLSNLETTFRARIITMKGRDEFLNVMLHSTCPEEKLIIYPPTHFTLSVNAAIVLQLNNCLSLIKEFNIGNYPIKLSKGLATVRNPSKKSAIINLLNEIQYHLENFGLYCSLFVLDSVVIELELKLRQSETVDLRLMYRAVISKLEMIRHIMFTTIKQTLDEDDPSINDCHKIDVILNFSTPRIIATLKYLEEVFKNKRREDVTCLLFVERRLTAKSLCCVIQKYVKFTPSLSEILFPEFMVGRNSMLSNSVETVLDRKWNRQVFADFRSGICNLMVCSSVLEEGIDVQACNHVIVFDPIKTFNSYIQTKGRARSREGAYYAMVVPKANVNAVIERIRTYKQTHEAIRNFLIERILPTPDISQDEIEKQFDDRMKPLKTPQGAILLPSGALTLLNRYCQMLPWDVFGCVLPQFKKLKKEQTSSVVVSLKLPLQSRVKEEILSDPMENAKMAKISVALRACQKLYQEGELNKNLLPTSKVDCIKSVTNVLFKHWEKYRDNVISKTDGKAKLRLYERKCPEELYNALPLTGQICYAYEIKITPDFGSRNSYNEHIVDALTAKSNYAILLSKKLPQLAVIQLFMQQGPLSVEINAQPIEFSIKTKEELEKLRKYHIMIMRDILECWRSYYVHDFRNKQNSFLIVPIKSGFIDWTVVDRFQRLKPLCKPSIVERQNRVYRPEDWLGKIVGKWYAPDTRERFLVTKVHTDRSPLTLFPDDKLTDLTYLSFFENRYGSTIDRIYNRNQFLIEVKPFTARRNFFNNAKSKDVNIKRDTQVIILLPELCHNFEHSGDLWLKALFLPSILHRVHFMLHAEKLRKDINSYLGLENLFVDYKPKPLIIDKSLRRAVDNDGNACVSHEDKTSLLPALPPSFPAEAFEICSLDSGADYWKAYQEPINIARQSRSIFPVELQYFHNFSSDMQKELLTKNLMQTEYSSNQFQMSTKNSGNPYVTSNFTNTIHAGMSMLAISDVSLEENRRIAILDRSMLRADFLPSLITPAEQHDFLAALTTSSANDVFDMERLELLGDSFLKFSSSLYLANKFPKWHEGFLTEVKSKLVSNRNLLYCLMDTDIPTRICSELFSMQEWMPPLVSLPSNFLDVLENDTCMRVLVSPRDLYDIQLDESEILSGRCNENHFQQFRNACERNDILSSDGLEVNLRNDLNFSTYKEVRADKIVSDTLEALLGVCVKNYGLHMSFRLLEFFRICRPERGEKPLTSLLDLKLGGRLLSTDMSTRDIDSFLINHEYLEANLGYKFKDRAFLLQALTHPTYPTNRITGCYQQLEFIGDAILDLLVSCYIFERCETMTPGRLTDLRSALVNNITLGCVCVRHRFHLFMLAENIILADAIKKFAAYQETQNHRVTNQVHILMEESDTIRSRTSPDENKTNISVNVEVPKALGDILEALIGAVYMDSRCLQTTWNVIYHLLSPEIHEFMQKVPLDPVRQLYEHPSAKPEFSDPINDNGTTMVKCTFLCLKRIVFVHGFGENKIQAKKSAAKHALQILSKTFNPANI